MAKYVTPELDIFDGKTQENFGDSLEVEAVKSLIQDIRAKGLMTPAKSVLCATALALARNIEAGNVKRRAIANEAAQLAAIVEQLTAEIGDSAGMTDEMKDLINALTIDPAAYAKPAASNPT